jgi:FkbM family methyltransferase
MPNSYESTTDWRYQSSLPASVREYRKYFTSGGNVVMDVGSRDGDDAQYLMDTLGASRAIAIDANPLTIPAIESAHPTVEVYSTAISNFSGTTEFTQLISEFDDIEGASSMYSNRLDPDSPEKDPMYDGIEQNILTVPVTTLDQFFVENDLSNSVIDFIKMDIEGYSWQAIDGLRAHISNVKMIHMETEYVALHSEHKSSLEVAELMVELGFTLVGIYVEWAYPIQDQLWVNNSLIDTEETPVDLIQHISDVNFYLPLGD